ncbi:Rv3654c family TadE-like protein [Geodermatophilus sp. SYSU D00815]
MSRDGERGSATVWVLALAGVLAAVGTAAVLLAAAVTARHRAGAAADLAALAAAAAAVRGDPGACAAAAELAARNGAELTSCALASGAVVAVTVAVPLRLGPLGAFSAEGRARAGPVGAGAEG